MSSLRGSLQAHISGSPTIANRIISDKILYLDGRGFRAKPIARFAGIAFATSGVISLLGALIAGFIVSQIIPTHIAGEFTALLPQLISDISHHLLIHRIVILVVGIGLIVLSIKLRAPD